MIKETTPIKIKYGSMKAPRYYCKSCFKRIKKNERICTSCLSRINWEEIIMSDKDILNKLKMHIQRRIISVSKELREQGKEEVTYNWLETIIKELNSLLMMIEEMKKGNLE